MPEFQLDRGDVYGSEWFHSLDEFSQGYVEALFFTETGTSDDDELEDATVADLSDDTRAAIVRECAMFQALCGGVMRELEHYKDHSGYNRTSMGHDFWFTRNGHGTGFWDRDYDFRRVTNLPDDALLDISAWLDHLGSACRGGGMFGEVTIYVGDDGLIYGL